jgi:hypothetical protein
MSQIRVGYGSALCLGVNRPQRLGFFQEMTELRQREVTDPQPIEDKDDFARFMGGDSS